MVIWALPLIVPTVARMVARELSPAGSAVNTVVAWPEALVTSEAGLKDPAVALITEKETLILGITLEEASVTVTVTLEVPPLAMVAEESDTCTAVGVPAAAGAEGGGLSVSTLHPLRTTASAIAAEMRKRKKIFCIGAPPKNGHLPFAQSIYVPERSVFPDADPEVT
jgi:hypothetical protein